MLQILRKSTKIGRNEKVFLSQSSKNVCQIKCTMNFQKLSDRKLKNNLNFDSKNLFSLAENPPKVTKIQSVKVERTRNKFVDFFVVKDQKNEKYKSQTHENYENLKKTIWK